MDFQALKAKVDFSEVDKARDAFKKLGDEVPGASSAVGVFGDAMAALQSPLTALVSGLATATAGAIGLGFAAINAADDMNDLVLRTGKSAQELQALGDVANKSGSDLGTMVDVLDQVSKKAAGAGDESKRSGKAFEYLGVSTKDANGHLKDSATLLSEGAAALDSMGHSADATAAFQDAYGRSALKNFASLKDLNGEIEKQKQFLIEVGGVMDGNLTAASDNYKDTMSDLGSVFKGFGNEIARTMLPLLTGLAQALINSSKNSGLLAVAFKVLEGAVWIIVNVAKVALSAIIGLDNAISNLIQSAQFMGQIVMAAVTGKWDEIPKLWDNYKTRIIKTNEETRDALGKVWSTVEKGDPTKDDEPGVSKGKYNPNNPKKDKTHRVQAIGESDFAKVYSAEMGELIKLNAAYSELNGNREATNTQLLQAKINAGDFAAKYKDAAGVVSTTAAAGSTLIKKAATEEELAVLKRLAAVKDENIERNRQLKISNELWRAAEQQMAQESQRATQIRQNSNLQAIQREVLMDFNATQGDVTVATAKFNIASNETALAIANASGATEQEIAVLLRKRSALQDILDVQLEDADAEKAEIARQRTFEYGWTKSFNQYQKDATNAASMAEKAFSSTTRTMDSALTEFATTGKINFRSLVSSMLAEMAKVQAAQASSSIFGSLVGMATSFFGGGMTSTAGMSGIAEGGINNGLPAYGLAVGTNYVPYDGMRAILHQGEAVVPKQFNPAAGGSASAGNGTTINAPVTVNFSGDAGSEQDRAQLAKHIDETVDIRVRKILREESRSGGSLNPVRR